LFRKTRRSPRGTPRKKTGKLNGGGLLLPWRKSVKIKGCGPPGPAAGSDSDEKEGPQGFKKKEKWLESEGPTTVRLPD